MEKNQKNIYADFINTFIATIRKLNLYPSKHPTSISSIKNLYTKLQALFSITGVLTLTLSSDSQILIEGEIIGEKGSRLVEDLARYFKKTEIESLNFNPGITDIELQEFIKILLMEEDELKKMGDLSNLFTDRGIKNIKIAQFSYIKVEKGKTVLEIDEERKNLFEALKKRVKDFSQDKIKNQEDIQVLQKDVVGMVAAEYQENKKLRPAVKNMLRRYVLKTEEVKSAFATLKDAMVNAGCHPDEADKLIGEIEGQFSRKSVGVGGGKAEDSRILRKEVQELRLQIDHLKEEIDKKNYAYEELKTQVSRTVQEKERIDNIVHHMAEGLVVVDPDGKIIMLNPVAEKLLGISKSSVGMALNETVKEEHLLTMVKNISSEKDGTLEKDIEFIGPDESTKRVLRTSSAVVEDPNGKTVGMVTILNDITRQKEIENMKSAFVANVTHELRTPLATVQQNLSLLIDGLAGVLNETQTKFLNISHDNLKRLSRLINDLLDSAAIEAGRLKLRLAKSDIKEMVSSVAAFLGRWAQTKNIAIETELFPEHVELEMDKDRIEQVLTNLLSNAIKFTPDGGRIFVSGVIREFSEEFPDGGIEISVRDTGQGIAPEYMDKLFKKFERAEAVNSGIGGTGLGLSICKEIIKLHGGKIWVVSRVNEGSRFSFILPKKAA